ncbi:uncharacterized protein LOC110104803 [Dendrobium catenatum]|uniref:uncharacterized protein LOC110104803 n=1 Tax=Dendrobium catenatum TaxID=906689 RepID=UPI0009F59B80|nr:uncharacterized protein LOC110104803 [Dendrobium catenatum]
MAKALNSTSDILLLPDLRHEDLFIAGDKCNLSPPELHSSNGDSVSALSRRVAQSFLHKDEDFNSLLIKRKQNSSASSKRAGDEFYQNRSFTEQKLELARFHDLEQQQLTKNQLSTARRLQSIAKVSRPLGFLSSSASPSVLQSQASSGMHVVFLNPRKESSGTGVFLPRQPGSPNKPRKQPACSTALLPARVVQALNLNQDDLCLYPRAPSHGIDLAGNQKRSSSINQSTWPAGAADRLPSEWTY